MATILARIRVKKGSEAPFESTVRALFAESHSVEKALRCYEYWRAQEPGLYYCLLAFNDFLGFLEHQSSAHHEAAAPALIEMISDLQLEWVDPVFGASPLPETSLQKLPDAASELIQRYAKLFPVCIADWWPQRPPKPDARSMQ
jgi:quinol monooxygenase YgiN